MNVLTVLAVVATALFLFSLVTRDGYDRLGGVFAVAVFLGVLSLFATDVNVYFGTAELFKHNVPLLPTLTFVLTVIGGIAMPYLTALPGALAGFVSRTVAYYRSESARYNPA
jgi:Mn2+/Fe2+ NRAMP family transporter